ncbi:MAG TPA: TlpA disulfide reductase family protein [Burkholderiales bacterium]|nr:TlpA disulfide reductase family protein [Burkholderiales bacterium]
MGIAIGPFVFSANSLVLLASIAVAFVWMRRESRRAGRDLERHFWITLLVSLVVARLGYVLTRLPHFSAAPLEALYFWQDGYLVWLGILPALLMAHALAERHKYRPRHLLVPLFAGLAVWILSTWTIDNLRQATERFLPPIALNTLSNTQVEMTQYKGQPTVVNLWATWCPPCRREMPVLEAAQAKHADVHFVFANQGEDAGVITRYLAAQSLDLRNVVLDQRTQLSQHFAARGMPTTLFFDADGRLADMHLGELSHARLADYIDALKSAQYTK